MILLPGPQGRLLRMREALFEMPETRESCRRGPKRRQIMAHCFPYIAAKTITDDELLEQLREDIKAAMGRLADAEGATEQVDPLTERRKLRRSAPAWPKA